MTTATPDAASVRAGHPAVDRVRLRSEVNLAGRVLAPLWPIETFIAVNPLGGFEDRPFAAAVAEAGRLLGARGTLDEAQFRALHHAGRITGDDLRAAVRRLVPDLAGNRLSLGGQPVDAEELVLTELLHGEPAGSPVRTATTLAEQAPQVARAVDAQSVRWCAAFLDGGQASWSMPGREDGFYPAWRALAAEDRTLSRASRRALSELPQRPEDAVLDALHALGVPTEQHRAYLRAHLTGMPGWAAHVRWHAENGAGIDLVGYLAMRLTYEHLLLPDGPAPAVPATPAGDDPEARAALVAAALRPRSPADAVTPAELAAVAEVLAAVPAAQRPQLWLAAYEGHYRDALVTRLSQPLAPAEPERPVAQLVCCIDVRSEGLRRHLEGLGPYETLGFAGFFGVAIRFTGLAAGASAASCPVLLKPANDVREQASGGGARRELAGLQALAGAEDGFHAAKDDLAGPFALAEASGWVAGPLAAAKTVLAGPYGRARHALRNAAVAPTTTDLELGFTPEERTGYAQVALTMMGLTSGFGRLVVLCGHGSTTENNPYASSLDCGACGGNRGGPNARTAATLLNADDVRAHLREVGIDVPADTWFVAAEHDTATDGVTVLDRHLVPASHRDVLASMEADLRTAGDELAAERCALLPGAPRRPSARRGGRHVRARSTDWAQVYPEWGLAGNAAFVVGPRALTAGLDLERRVFLHSYEASVDTDGAALETILTAPLVVAQWISCQYYFSSVDPQVFGSGTKTIHNVVGGIGVLAGHDGDLQLGLPWQSVADGRGLRHEPMRLLALVQAPLDRVQDIIDRNAVLQRLFGNGWVALAAREHGDEPWQRHTDRGWTPWLTSREASR